MFFTLFTPYTSSVYLVARSFSARFSGFAAQGDHAVFRLDRGVEAAGRAMIEQRRFDQGGEEASSIDSITVSTFSPNFVAHHFFA